MGIKNFFRKIGQGIKKGGRWVWNGIKKAGRWAKDNILPHAINAGKTVLNILGLLPGKFGMFGKIGGAIANGIGDIVNTIPNEDVKQKVNNFIARGNEKFQGVIDKGKDYAEDANRIANGIANGVGNMYNNIKNELNDETWKKLNQKIRTMPVDTGSKIDVNRWKKNNM